MMKKILPVLISIFFVACSKDDDSKNIPITEENIVISQNEIYEYDLEFPGDEDGFSITRQAVNCEISKIEQDSITGNFIYTYKPEAGFTGTDTVEITHNAYSISRDEAYNVRIIRINIEARK